MRLRLMGLTLGLMYLFLSSQIILGLVVMEGGILSE